MRTIGALAFAVTSAASLPAAANAQDAPTGNIGCAVGMVREATGLPPLGLKWADVDLLDGTISVRRALYRAEGRLQLGKLMLICMDLSAAEQLLARPTLESPPTLPPAPARIPSAPAVGTTGRVVATVINPPWYRDELSGVLIKTSPGSCYVYLYGDRAILESTAGGGNLTFSTGKTCHVAAVYAPNANLFVIGSGIFEDRRTGAIVKSYACSGIGGPAALVTETEVIFCSGGLHAHALAPARPRRLTTHLGHRCGCRGR